MKEFLTLGKCISRTKLVKGKGGKWVLMMTLCSKKEPPNLSSFTTNRYVVHSPS